MVRNNGATKVFFASAAPPIRHQNVYGIDMPATAELVAHNRTVKQVEKFIGADTLISQQLAAFKLSAHVGNKTTKLFEDSVFIGDT